MLAVAVLCEFSGVVRDAFIARGHNAVSCDLLPTERPGPHIQADCRALDWSVYDLVIAHPPCTYLAVSGAAHFRKPGRMQKQTAALDFVRWLFALDVPRLCVENPVSVISGSIAKPTQVIHPWQFGHGEKKATCLWLKGLPPLKPTNVVDGREGKILAYSPSPERWKLRSRTYAGIARAMSEQWG